MKVTIALCMLATTALWILSSSAGVYKIVDPETGRVLYTDTPPPGHSPDQPVTLPPVNTQQTPVIPAREVDTETEPAKVNYDRITILQPADDTTITPGQLDVVVQVKAQPELQEGDLIRVLFNGKPVGSPASTSSIVLRELIRGSHQIQAQIVDSNGKVLKSSKTITIHVKRPFQ